LQGRGLKQRVIEAHERWMLRKVDIVLVSGPLDATIVRDHYRLENEPHVILNVPPFKERVESDILRKHHGIADVDCIVLYQGVVHHGRGIAPFMKSMVHVHDVHLCIVGDGPAVADLQLLSAELDVADRVHWHGAVSYDDLHDVTCSADVGLCLIEPVSKSYEYALPNKLFEYMMAGLPVLATDLPALRMQLGQTPVGMLVERTLKTTSIVAALQQVRVPATYEGMRDACRAIRDLSYERQAQYIIDLVRVGT
jgi:glycosyltransferase involved in cell wall biosynthesis